MSLNVAWMRLAGGEINRNSAFKLRIGSAVSGAYENQTTSSSVGTVALGVLV
jgi:hypothetical protein